MQFSRHRRIGTPFNFVIRIRHPDSVAHLGEQQQALSALLRSIDAQTNRDFSVLIVCNPGQVLPELPDYAHRIEIDLPPNAALERAQTLEERAIAVRDDKGRRMAPALDAVAPDAYVMMVDDDDFVSCRLVEHVLSHDERVGWLVADGYVWKPGEDVFYELINFHRLCGTSLIVPAQYFKYVQRGVLDFETIQEMGSHRTIVDEADLAGHKFRWIPFPGAVYRKGHQNAAQVQLQRIAAQEAARSAPDPLAKRVLDMLRKARRKVFPEKRSNVSSPKVKYDQPIPITGEMRAEFFGEGTKATATKRAVETAV